MPKQTFYFISCAQCRISQPLSWYLNPNQHSYCLNGHRMAQKFVIGRLSDKECTTSCVNAKGSDCECSCGGKDHGRYA